MGREAEGIITAVKGIGHYRQKFPIRTLFTVHEQYRSYSEVAAGCTGSYCVNSKPLKYRKNNLVLLKLFDNFILQ